MVPLSEKSYTATSPDALLEIRALDATPSILQFRYTGAVEALKKIPELSTEITGAESPELYQVLNQVWIAPDATLIEYLEELGSVEASR